MSTKAKTRRKVWVTGHFDKGMMMNAEQTRISSTEVRFRINADGIRAALRKLGKR